MVAAAPFSSTSPPQSTPRLVSNLFGGGQLALPRRALPDSDTPPAPRELATTSRGAHPGQQHRAPEYLPPSLGGLNHAPTPWCFTTVVSSCRLAHPPNSLAQPWPPPSPTAALASPALILSSHALQPVANEQRSWGEPNEGKFGTGSVWGASATSSLPRKHFHAGGRLCIAELVVDQLMVPPWWRCAMASLGRSQRSRAKRLDRRVAESTFPAGSITILTSTSHESANVNYYY